MSLTQDELLNEAMKLSPQHRTWLAEELIKTLAPRSSNEIESAWIKETESRSAAIERGELPLDSAEDVFAEMDRLLRERARS